MREGSSIGFIVQAHGILGLIVGVVAVIRAVWIFGRGRWPADRLISGLFTGLIDLQALLGIIRLFGKLPTGSAWLHPVLMIVAVVLAHMGAARLGTDPRPGSSGAWMTWGAFILIIVGISLVL